MKDSKTQPSLLEQALIHYDKHEYESALGFFNQARKEEFSPDHFAWRGICNFHCKRDEEALEDFNVAIEKGNATSAIYKKRAAIFLTRGENAEALDSLEQIDIPNPFDGELDFIRAIYYFSQDNKDEGLSHLRKALNNQYISPLEYQKKSTSLEIGESSSSNVLSLKEITLRFVANNYKDILKPCDKAAVDLISVLKDLRPSFVDSLGRDRRSIMDHVDAGQQNTSTSMSRAS